MLYSCTHTATVGVKGLTTLAHKRNTNGPTYEPVGGKTLNSNSQSWMESRGWFCGGVPPLKLRWSFTTGVMSALLSPALQDQLPAPASPFLTSSLHVLSDSMDIVDGFCFCSCTAMSFGTVYRSSEIQTQKLNNSVHSRDVNLSDFKAQANLQYTEIPGH